MRDPDSSRRAWDAEYPAEPAVVTEEPSPVSVLHTAERIGDLARNLLSTAGTDRREIDGLYAIIHEAVFRLVELEEGLAIINKVAESYAVHRGEALRCEKRRDAQ